jgi:hypothetical protein
VDCLSALRFRKAHALPSPQENISGKSFVGVRLVQRSSNGKCKGVMEQEKYRKTVFRDVDFSGSSEKARLHSEIP